MICFLKSSVSNLIESLRIYFLYLKCAYAIDSTDLNHSLIDEQYGLNLPSYFYDRNIRTTKFPRIGRRSMDESEEILSTNIESDEESLEERSVHFPRIGKRAFHNLLWANSRSNPHRMLDGQGRYYLNGYNYNIHPIPPKSMSRHRA